MAIEVGRELGLDARAAEARRARRAVPRHRQDRDPGVDPHEARPADRRGAVDDRAAIRSSASGSSRRSTSSQAVRPIVRACHERYDGLGLPGRPHGRRDPARGADHLRLRRVPRDDDRPPLPRGAARSRRRSGGSSSAAGTQFDPVVVEVCLRVLKQPPPAARLSRASRRGAAPGARAPRTGTACPRAERRRRSAASSGSAVQSSCAQRRPKRVGGRTNVTGSRQALKRTMNDSSAIGSPSARQRRDLGAVQERAERERVAARPVGLRHPPPVGPEPPDVRGARALPLLAGQERRPPEHGMLGAEPQQPLGELEDPVARARRAPSRPTRARCPGSRRCCSRAACAGARRRRAASASPARGAASRGSCGSAGRAAR